MNLAELKTHLHELAQQAQGEFEQQTREDELVQLKNKYLGRKGHLKSLGAQVGKLPSEDRPLVGREINTVKSLIEGAFQNQLTTLRNLARERKLQKGRVDLTLPPRCSCTHSGHPLIQIELELIRIFRSMGFDVASGPEIEDDYHNFEALNFPPDHPARDMQDTILVDTVDERRDLVMRTHTSPVQIRTLLKYNPPVQIIAPGTVYRHDHDATHSPVFRQIECLHIGTGITMQHLKGTLTHFIHTLFGPETKLRMRPSYFPFTEPSAEIDISCIFCGGEGCRICSNTGWIEVLGSGMVDPNVLKACDVDPDVYSGYAFGIGVERVAMLKLAIPDIRVLYTNDMRFLEQY